MMFSSSSKNLLLGIQNNTAFFEECMTCVALSACMGWGVMGKKRIVTRKVVDRKSPWHVE